jgi:DNA primase
MLDLGPTNSGDDFSLVFQVSLRVKGLTDFCFCGIKAYCKHSGCKGEFEIVLCSSLLVTARIQVIAKQQAV